ncbi:MAG: hypothetical protein ABI210_05325 [Abditibacteriaceae bacterium]
MKNTWKVAVTVAAAAFIGTAGSARADLTLNGETGMFINPTAQVVQKGHGEIGINYYRIASGFGGKIDQYGIVGAASLTDRLELSGGIGRDQISGGGGSFTATNSSFGLKYQIQNSAKDGYDLAIGGLTQNLNLAGIDLSDSVAYLTATKAFGHSENRSPILATVGLRLDHIDLPFGAPFSDNQFSVYAGAQVPLAEGLNLIGEVGTKTYSLPGTKIPYAIGLRYSPKDKGFSISGGIQRSGLSTVSLFGPGGGSSNNFFLQAGYTFGK